MISGFGLSAFFFSTIATLFFHGDPSSLLLLLSLGTTIPFLIGFFIVKPVPHDDIDSDELPESEDIHAEPIGGTLYQSVPTEDSGYLAVSAVEGGQQKSVSSSRNNSRTRLYSRDRGASSSGPRYPPRRGATLGIGVDLHGIEMFKTSDFWLLFIPMVFCASFSNV